MKREEFKLFGGNAFVSYDIPVVMYEYENKDKLNSDLLEIIDELEKFYVETKADTSKKGDGNTKTKSILTHNFNNFNILDRVEYDSILEFKDFISSAIKDYIQEYTNFPFENVWCSMWANKLGQYDYLNKHTHVMNVGHGLEFSANYFVKGVGHDTYTKYYSPLSLEKEMYMFQKNVEGQLTVFPSFVAHDTTPNRTSDKYRYSLGMDICNADENNLAHKSLVELS